MIRILLVDDHKVLRDALRDKLDREPDFEVIAEAGTSHEALSLVKDLRPDIVVLDISLGEESGIEVVDDILKCSPGTRIIALSMYVDQYHIKEMLKAGADGYIAKTASKTELIDGICAVASGNRYLCAEASATLVSGFRQGTDETGELTSRERQVLTLLAEGKRSGTIAELLHISVSTVEVHRRNIMRKLNLHTIAELTHYAIQRGLTPL
ncbi:MAG: response regulator transcription factor [Pseudomonadales bacterium]